MVFILGLIAVLPIFVFAQVYFLYFASLKLAAMFVPNRATPAPLADDRLPKITTIIAAYNQEALICDRIQNIWSQDYPADRIEVIVASDGSTDRTPKISEDAGARVVHAVEKVGKSTMQNRCVEAATGDIVVFTGVYTTFADDFLRKVGHAFADDAVAVVDGRLDYRPADDASLGVSQGAYWRMEMATRKLESDLGILLVSAGACVAARKSAVVPFPPHVGEDCVLPLDAARQGLRTVHLDDAIAYDSMKQYFTSELAARVRMTQRNWQGTLLYHDLLNPFRSPVASYVLFSHKLLRWLLPVLAVFSLIASVALAAMAVSLGWAMLALYALAAVLVALGRRAAKSAAPSRMAMFWAFAVVNYGFAKGIYNATVGGRIYAYRS